MTTKSKLNLVKLMFLSVITALVFVACSDDTLDSTNDNAATEMVSGSEKVKEAIGLVYNDFIDNNDVQILDADTTQIAVSKAYADKMGVSNFVNHPMGIWKSFEDRPFLRRATAQELVGDKYILTVIPSSIGEVVQGKDVTIQTSIYANPNAGATRSGVMGNVPDYAAKYIDEMNIVHPIAVKFISRPGEGGNTRGFISDYGTFTPEQILNGEFDANTRWGFGDLWSWVEETTSDICDKAQTAVIVGHSIISKVVDKISQKADEAAIETFLTVDNVSTVDINAYGNKRILKTHTEITPPKMKINCGKEESDTLSVGVKVPVDFRLDCTVQLKAGGSITSGYGVDLFETRFDGELEMNPELTFGFGKEVEIPENWQRAKISDLGEVGFVFMIGTVPVYIDIQPSIYLKLDGKFEGNVCTGIAYDFGTKFSVGAMYKDGWSGISDGEITKNEFRLIPPEGSCELKAGVGLVLGIDIMADKVAGPAAYIGPMLKGNVNMKFSPLSDEIVDFNASVKFGLYGNIAAEIKMWKIELAEWGTDITIGDDITLLEYPSNDGNTPPLNQLFDNLLSK